MPPREPIPGKHLPVNDLGNHDHENIDGNHFPIYDHGDLDL